MKVWITKYALTKGIYEAEADNCCHDGMVVVGYNCYHGEGKEWCMTREEAVHRAEEMRQKKIENLKSRFRNWRI